MEGRLPASIDAIQRLVGARSDEERLAVQLILEEFFAQSSDGWICARLDALIEAFKAKSEKSRNAASSRWNKRLDAQTEYFADAMRPQSEGITNHQPLTEEPKSEYPKITHTQPSAETVSPPFKVLNANFREFWDAAPRTKSENFEKTKEIYQTTICSLGPAGPAFLLAKIKDYAASVKGRDIRYIKSAHLWLDDRYWADDL
jgi:uncharacterized protein YdaU (DUF1376 family)